MEHYCGRSNRELDPDECPVSSEVSERFALEGEIIIPGIIWCQVIRDELAFRFGREAIHERAEYDS